MVVSRCSADWLSAICSRRRCVGSVAYVDLGVHNTVIDVEGAEKGQEFLQAYLESGRNPAGKEIIDLHDMPANDTENTGEQRRNELIEALLEFYDTA